MASGARRFARQQLDLDEEFPEIPEFPQGVVTAVAAGAGADGLDVVTVSYNGASLKCTHLTSYTPVVNHVVALGRSGGNYLVLGRPGGFPTSP